MDNSDESTSNGLIPGTPHVVDFKESPRYNKFSQDGFNGAYRG